MRLLIALVVCVAASASGKLPSPLDTTVFDYHRRFGIPLAEKIRKYEEQIQNDPSRIVGGSPSPPVPFQVGLIGAPHVGDFVTVCGGVLLTESRTVTAAHCWRDGNTQLREFTVVCGSNLLFSGGYRSQTSAVVVHENFSALLSRDNLAMVFHNNKPITGSNLIRPAVLPTSNMMSDSFSNNLGVISGYGMTTEGQNIGTGQTLSRATVIAMTNLACGRIYPLILRGSHICTEGTGGVGKCNGDFGGPFTVTRGGVEYLVGVSSFVSSDGCASGNPTVHSRVTEYVDWMRRLM